MKPKLKNKVFNIHEKELLESFKHHFMLFIVARNRKIIYANTNFYKVFEYPSRESKVESDHLLMSLVYSKELYKLKNAFNDPKNFSYPQEFKKII